MRQASTALRTRRRLRLALQPRRALQRVAMGEPHNRHCRHQRGTGVHEPTAMQHFFVVRMAIVWTGRVHNPRCTPLYSIFPNCFSTLHRIVIGPRDERNRWLLWCGWWQGARSVHGSMWYQPNYGQYVSGDGSLLPQQIEGLV